MNASVWTTSGTGFSVVTLPCGYSQYPSTWISGRASGNVADTTAVTGNDPSVVMSSAMIVCVCPPAMVNDPDQRLYPVIVSSTECLPGDIFSNAAGVVPRNIPSKKISAPDGVDRILTDVFSCCACDSGAGIAGAMQPDTATQTMIHARARISRERTRDISSYSTWNRKSI